MTSPLTPPPSDWDVPVVSTPPVPPPPQPDTAAQVAEQPVQPPAKQPNWLLIFGGTAAAILLLGVGVIVGTAIRGSEPKNSAEVADAPDSPFPAAQKKCTSAATSTFAPVGDEGRSLTIEGRGQESAGLPYSEVRCILRELDTPDAVIAQIESTRALDGRQSAEWDGIKASWTYHPDSGLQMILTFSN